MISECGVSKHYRQRRPRLEEHQAESNKSSRMIDFDEEDDRVLKSRHKAARIINGKESKPGAFPWQVLTHTHTLLLSPSSFFKSHHRDRH